MVCPRHIPGILISNVSFPKSVEKAIIQDSQSCDLMLPYLRRSINQLIRAGADFIVMPCNTLHALLPRLRKEFDVKFLDLIEETSKEIEKEYSAVGILGSSKTKESDLYGKNLLNVKVIYPTEEEQKKLSEIIVRIISLKAEETDRRELLDMINRLYLMGAEKIIFACTDLGNLIKEDSRVLDSTSVLIKSIKKASQGDCSNLDYKFL